MSYSLKSVGSCCVTMCAFFNVCLYCYQSRAVGSELSEASVQRLQEQLEELSQAFIFEDDETSE